MSSDSQVTNWYTRICVIVFLLFLGCLVYWSFRFGTPQYQITTSILLALSLMAVAILADSFSSISFGTIFQLKKEVTRAETEKKEAKDEARELRTSLVSLATNIHQSQVTTNISGMDIATLRRVLGVVEASPEEKKTAEDEVSENNKHEISGEESEPEKVEDSYSFRQELREVIENDLFRRFIAKYKIPPLELRREVRFDAGLENIDPIMNKNIIYDGYVRTDQKEYFIEASSLLRGPSVMRADRLYVALAKVLFYKQVKKVDAELVLLDVLLPEDSGERSSSRSRARLLEWFQPAIAGSLLRVETCSLSLEEFNAFKDEARKNLS